MENFATIYGKAVQCPETDILFRIIDVICRLLKSGHRISYSIRCPPSEDSDQAAHSMGS